MTRLKGAILEHQGRLSHYTDIQVKFVIVCNFVFPLSKGSLVLSSPSEDLKLFRSSRDSCDPTLAWMRFGLFGQTGPKRNMGWN